MKKKPGKKIEKIVEVETSHWLSEVRIIAGSMKYRVDETSDEAMSDLWEVIYSALTEEGIALLDIDINQLQITRKETK